MHSIILRTSLFGRAMRTTLFGAQAGQRWLFRRNRGWLGGDRMTDRFVLWICFAFALLGVVLLARQPSGFLSIASSARWTAVSARIISLRIDDRPSALGVNWVPHITYSYSVAGRQYQSSRVSVAGLAWTSREEANAFLARYVGHADVLAYYNPKQPSEAVLEEQGGLLDTATLTGVLLIALALGTLVIYVQLR